MKLTTGPMDDENCFVDMPSLIARNELKNRSVAAGLEARPRPTAVGTRMQHKKE